MSVPVGAIEQRLSQEAEKLHKGRRTPIDVAALLEWVGINLRVQIDPTNPSHGSLLWTDTGVEVIVRREKPRAYLSPRERFTVAHELGHFFIEARFGYKPVSEAEYWQVEALCNAFAGRLLLPEGEVRGVLQPWPNTPARLLQSVHRLAEKHSVSFQVAGREVVTYVGTASVGELSDRQEGRSLGKVLWNCERHLFVGLGRGAHIMPENPLADVMRDHAKTHDGARRETRVRGIAIASRRTGRVIRIAALIPSGETEEIHPTVGSGAVTEPAQQG